MYLFIQVESQSQCRPVTTLPPPLSPDGPLDAEYHFIANNVDALLQLLPAMPNDLLALPFHFQIERKTVFFTNITRRIQRLVRS